MLCAFTVSPHVSVIYYLCMTCPVEEIEDTDKVLQVLGLTMQMGGQYAE